MEDKLIDNLIAKKKAREAAIPLRQRINKKTDKVTVFLLSEQKEREVFPVDAREMIEMGVATLDPVEIVGSAGRVKIDAGQLPEYLAKGYTLVEDTKPQKAEDTGASTDSEGNAGTTNDESSPDSDEGIYSQFDDEQLAVFARQAGLPGTIKKRETIIQKLIEKNFNPNTGSEAGNE